MSDATTGFHPTSTRRPRSEPELSIVSPVYLGEASIDELVERVKRHAGEVTDRFEIVLVDDSSPDDSWHRIARQCRQDPRVRGIRLSRNFGQHYAITAGLEAARGRYVVVLDCDLQDDPRYIPALYGEALKGFDIVYTRRRSRGGKGLRGALRRMFFWALNRLITNEKFRVDGLVGNYSVLSRRAVDAVTQMKDYHRHYLALLRWVGFDHTSMEIERVERPYGKSSYTFRRLVGEAVVGITSQSERLLVASIAAGFTFVGVSFALAASLVVLYFVQGFLTGWTSLAVLILLSTGVILLCLGVTGIYVGKTFEQAKSRPLYLVSESLNFEGDAQERNTERIHVGLVPDAPPRSEVEGSLRP